MATEKARDPFLALIDQHHELDDLTANEPWSQDVPLLAQANKQPTRRHLLASWLRFPLLVMGSGMFAWWTFVNKFNEEPGNQ